MDNYPYVSYVRGLLGLTEAIPVGKIPEALSKFEAEPQVYVDTAMLVLYYPKAKYSLSDDREERFSTRFETYEIEHIALPADRSDLLTFKSIVDGVAAIYSVHPALVLAFFLSELNLREEITVLIENGHVALAIPTINATDREIRQAYSETRKVLGLEKSKARRVSDRVRRLSAFRSLHQQLTWRELLNEWNAQYPHWKYNNASSLQVVFSRRAKQHKHRESWVEEWRRKYDDYHFWQEAEATLYDEPGWAKIPEAARKRIVRGQATEEDNQYFEDIEEGTA
jgi:hypothetical protein